MASEKPRKEKLISQLNELLDIRLSHWQFGYIRVYELAELVEKVKRLKEKDGQWKA